MYHIYTEASDEEEPADIRDDEIDNLHQLTEKLNELKTTNALVIQKHQDILRAVSEIETPNRGSGVPTLSKLNEKASMFKITANAMAKVRYNYLSTYL